MLLPNVIFASYGAYSVVSLHIYVSCLVPFFQLCVAGVGYLEEMLAVRTPLTEEEFEASNKGQVARLLREGEGRACGGGLVV